MNNSNNQWNDCFIKIVNLLSFSGMDLIFPRSFFFASIN